MTMMRPLYMPIIIPIDSFRPWCVTIQMRACALKRLMWLTPVPTFILWWKIILPTRFMRSFMRVILLRLDGAVSYLIPRCLGIKWVWNIIKPSLIRTHLKNASKCPWRCCNPIQNAHILTCMLRFRIGLRLALNPNPPFWDGFKFGGIPLLKSEFLMSPYFLVIPILSLVCWALHLETDLSGIIITDTVEAWSYHLQSRSIPRQKKWAVRRKGTQSRLDLFWGQRRLCIHIHCCSRSHANSWCRNRRIWISGQALFRNALIL